jgi:hypothetical protein
MEGKSRLAEGVQIALRNPDVDRLSKHMQALGGYLAIIFTKIGVGGGASISGDDVEGLVGLELSPEGV